MSYNNGFPMATTYQPVQYTQPQVGYTQTYNNQPMIGQQGNIQQQSQPQFNQISDNRIMVNGVENAKLYPIGM